MMRREAAMDSLPDPRQNIPPTAGAEIAVEIGCRYRRGIQDWLECGRLLKIQKDALNHGQWLPWLKENRERLGFGERVAQRLIEAAANRSLTADLWWNEKRAS